MRKGGNLIHAFMITTQLEPENFIGWSDDELKTLEDAKNGNILGFMTVILKRMVHAHVPASELYGNIHDNDWREKWDDAELKMIKELKTPHIHIVGKLWLHAPDIPDFQGATIEQIASAVGIAPNMIEKPKKGRFAYDNMLAYLIHAKDADKTPYDPHNVVSTGLIIDDKPIWTNYMDIYSERKVDWDNGRAKKTKQKATVDVDLLTEMILTGQISRQQVILTDDYYNVYSRNYRQIDDAFRIYGERRAYKTLQALENGEFKLSVFFITGEPGAGKTRLAKAFVDSLIKTSAEYDEAWRVCQTAASNPMDDYNGEEILFMDDIRGSALSASDWLKLLDNHNASPASARYHNRMPACRAIIITSTKEPVEFFYYCKAMGGGDRSEALDQFMRRIQCLTKVIKADDFLDTKAMISESKNGSEYVAQIGDNETVKLTYSFDNETEYSFDDAVEQLTNIVRENNKMFKK